MKVNVNIEISDAQRVMLAGRLDGKVTKRKVTRCEVRDLVNAIVQGLTDSDYTTPVRSDSPERRIVSDGEDALIKRLRADGYNDQYIRGALQVYRSVHG